MLSSIRPVLVASAVSLSLVMAACGSDDDGVDSDLDVPTTLADSDITLGDDTDATIDPGVTDTEPGE